MKEKLNKAKEISLGAVNNIFDNTIYIFISIFACVGFYSLCFLILPITNHRLVLAGTFLLGVFLPFNYIHMQRAWYENNEEKNENI